MAQGYEKTQNIKSFSKNLIFGKLEKDFYNILPKAEFSEFSDHYKKGFYFFPQSTTSRAAAYYMAAQTENLQKPIF